ncbi:MAG: ABC transporter substrate-binding protein [Chlorobiaceae bacterium]
MTENSEGVIAVCGSLPLNRKTTYNGIPLLKKGAINLYINMPCPLKVVTKMAISEFAENYNSSHNIPIYSPMLLDGDSKGIEGELKSAQTEDDLPEVLIASGLHTVLSRQFKERFINTGIYTGISSDEALKIMPAIFQNLVKEHNIGIFAIGYWSIVVDLSTNPLVPYPYRWIDLVNPRYKDLITVHGYNGKASIASLLLILKEQLGSNATTDFACNIRNVWHFAEVLKRLDSSEPRRTPFNLLPNAATVQIPSRKNAAILEFEDGPILAPMLMFVKTSKIEECLPIVTFFRSNIMRQALKRGDFHLAEHVNWQEPFSFPSWTYLLNNDYEALVATLDIELKKGLRPDVFQR